MTKKMNKPHVLITVVSLWPNNVGKGRLILTQNFRKFPSIMARMSQWAPQFTIARTRDFISQWTNISLLALYSIILSFAESQ